MTVRTVTFVALGAVALLVSGILALQERSRLAVRRKNASVQGEVTKSIESMSSGKIRRKECFLEYRYAVDGRTHESGERRVGGPIPERQPVQVWYDPASPSRCVSDPELAYGMNLKFVTIWGVGGAILLLAAVKPFFRRA